jgi:hypothetical protein
MQSPSRPEPCECASKPADERHPPTTVRYGRLRCTRAAGMRDQ